MADSPVPPNSGPDRNHALSTPVMKETISAVHRASTHPDSVIRSAAVASLEAMAAEAPLLVLQTWLDQFARTNGGSTLVEYTDADRIRLLESLDRIVERVVKDTSDRFGDTNVAHKACVGRILTMASDELTKHPDIIPDVQKPCSNILVKLSGRFIDRVMDILLMKFQPNHLPHCYVVNTMKNIATEYPMTAVPYLKGVLGTMVANMKVNKNADLRYAYVTAFTSFADALCEYLSNIETAPDPSVTKEHFHPEFNLIFDHLFTNWHVCKESKVKNGCFEALGRLAGLIAQDRLVRNACQVLTMLINNYKKITEPYYVTNCLAQVIAAVSANGDATVIDPVCEPLLTALFTQMCTPPNDFSKPLAMRNHNEVLRCYDVLVKDHSEKLVAGLITRMGSVDENIRLAALTIFKHLITSSKDRVEDRMEDIFRAVHAKLGQESSNKVKKMLARITAQFGHCGLITNNEESKQFTDFIVRLCALNAREDGNSKPDPNVVTDAELRGMGDSILHLWAKSVPDMEPVLWPEMLDSLVTVEYTQAIPSIIKSLLEIVTRKNEVGSFEVNYSQFKNVQGPYAVFARLIVLVAVPLPDQRGSLLLQFLKHFSANINKHLTSLWSQRIPLLQKYLETSIGSVQRMGASWNQNEWDTWLLDLVDATVQEVDLEEWTTALMESMQSQLQLYSKDALPERRFLMKCLGVVANRSKTNVMVTKSLQKVYESTLHDDEEVVVACAKAFGLMSSRHLKLVLNLLEEHLCHSTSKKTNSFLFGLLKDSKAEAEQVLIRNTILSCVGQAALHSNEKELSETADTITVKFIFPALKAASDKVKVSALRATANLAKAVLKVSQGKVELSQHGDLIHEAIECIKKDWPLEDKQVAFDAIFYLIKVPPKIAETTRVSLLKACFNAVFPGITAQYYSKEESYSSLSKKEINLTRTVDRLLLVVEELLKQDVQQSTLDEIFTLVEHWMKRDYSLGREMAVTVLQTALRAFRENVTFERGEPSEFNPGPYIVGSIIPRCFDETRPVQTKAMDCLRTTVHILGAYEGMAQENVEEMLTKLKMLSAVSSPTGDGEEPINSTAVAQAVSDILVKRIQHGQLIPFLASTMDGLLDNVPCSARGTSIVLCNVLEARGRELYAQAADLVEKLHAKLEVFQGCEETRVRVLTCVRILASCNAREVTASLLSTNPSTSSGLMKEDGEEEEKEDVLPSIWKVLTLEQSLARDVMGQLLEVLGDKCLYAESCERPSCKVNRVANHEPAAAIDALKNMFEMKEMETILEGEFASVFVPIISAIGCFMGISKQGLPEPRKSAITTEDNKPFNRRASLPCPHLASPISRARDALVSFLICKGCPTTAKTVKAASQLESLDTSDDYVAMAEFVFSVLQSIIRDWPQFLTKLFVAFQSQLCSEMVGRRVVSLAFMRELVSTELPLEASLKRDAISSLLSAVQWEREQTEKETVTGGETDEEEQAGKREKRRQESNAMRVLCFEGLSELRAHHCENDLKEVVPRVLSAFIRVVGDDFKSEVNHSALSGLCKLLSSDALENEKEDVHRVMTDIANKIRPFFDCGRAQESSAAIRCFSQLSLFAVDSYKDVFLDNVHSALVSLLLHANDDEESVREASRDGLAQIVPILLTPEESETLSAPLLEENRPRFNYTQWLRELCRCGSLSDMFPMYVSAALSYVQSPFSQLRVGSVQLVTLIVLEMEDASALREGGQAESICKALANMLATDKTRSVQETAAASIGRVFVRLNQ